MIIFDFCLFDHGIQLRLWDQSDYSMNIIGFRLIAGRKEGKGLFWIKKFSDRLFWISANEYSLYGMAFTNARPKLPLFYSLSIEVFGKLIFHWRKKDW